MSYTIMRSIQETQYGQDDLLSIARNPTAKVLAATLWGEGRGEGVNGMLAIAKVITSRVKKDAWGWADNPRGVVLQDDQFSCWHAAPQLWRAFNEALGDVKPKAGALDDPEYIGRALGANLLDDKQAARVAYLIARLLWDYSFNEAMPAHWSTVYAKDWGDHYYAKSIPAPYWAKGKKSLGTLRNHKFYELVK